MMSKLIAYKQLPTRLQINFYLSLKMYVFWLSNLFIGYKLKLNIS